MEKKIKLIKNGFDRFNQFYKKKKNKDAIRCLKDILKLDPKNLQALFFLGITNVQNKKFDEAKKILLDFVKINPNYPNVHYNLGIINYNLNELKESINNYQTTLKIH